MSEIWIHVWPTILQVENCFEVTAKPRAKSLGVKRYLLAADSQASRDAWVKAIQRATVADMSANDDARLQVRVRETDKERETTRERDVERQTVREAECKEAEREP